MTKKLIIFVMIILCSANTYAWDASQYASSWGVPSEISFCGASNNEGVLIGADKGVCKGGKDNNLDKCKIAESYYKVGMMMMIARDLNEHGAYFCPTIIGGDRQRWELGQTSNKKPYWTIYKEPVTANATDCFWMCKPGYSGEGCQETTVSSCNLNTVKQGNWDSLKITSGVIDVEDDVAMFRQSETSHCVRYVSGVWPSPMEHDMILAVSGWTSSGHGVFVSPFVARSDFYSKRYSGGPGTSFAYSVGTQTLLCASGYEPNFNNSDCIPVDESLCAVTEAMESNETCNAKNASYASLDAFDSSTMELHYFDTDGCQGIICSQAGYGFDPNNIVRPTCIDCGMDDDVRNGIDKYGRCVRCDVGQIFNRMSSKCVPATVLDRDRLKFGPGKSASTPIIEQCWTQPDQYSYSDCVWAKTTSNTTAVVGGGRQVTGVYHGVATVADGVVNITNPTWLRPTETSGLTIGPYTGGVGGNSGSNNVNTSISSGFRMY